MRSTFQKSYLTVLFLSIAACSSPQKQFNPASQNDPNLVTIAVIGLNDFHGHILPKERKLPNGKLVQSGGAEPFFAMVEILKNEMPGRVLIVNAGDEWQGTLESNQVKGRSVVEFFNKLGVTVAAIGNHEFDFSVANLKAQAKFAKYPYVASNILDSKTKKVINWPNVFPSKMFKVAGIDVGVIGVTTVDTPETTRFEYTLGLDFIDAAKPVASEADQLRQKGADLVLVTAHAGTACKNGKGEAGNLKSWMIRDSKQKQGECEPADEIYRLAKEVGPQTLDGIVAGHTHQPIHHWLNEIPTVEGEAYNQYFNIIYYTFDRKTQKLVPELTRIEGLIPICLEVFKGTQHCDTRELKAGEAPEMVPFMFHGKKVEPSPVIHKWLEPIKKSATKYRSIVLAHSELPLTHYRDREGALGNLVADVIREKAKADIGLANSGGVRTALDSGEVTYDGIYRALPFDNMLNTISISGKDLKLLMRVLTAGNHGVPEISGLRIKLKHIDSDVPRSDLNGDGKLDHWEEDRLLELALTSGKPVQDDAEYKIATMDFLVKGGDNFRYFNQLVKIPEKKINKAGGYVRDLVMDYLKRKKVINTASQPLVDPASPRITVVK